MKIGDMFSAIDISASGLALQRKRMDAIASNLANADTVGANGQPYEKQVVQAVPGKAISFGDQLSSQLIPLETSSPGHMQLTDPSIAVPDYTVREVTGRVVQDPTATKMVYDPSNPNADANGYVNEPKINVVTEMVDMITTSRSYEANVTAINASKNIIKDSIDI
ncbi:MAG: flagellar basal body rod protein FlgC [Bacteroidetes bacterium]|nr:flagellar basal body rod protein FlgC [Bacteroidota bacterium]